MESKTKGGMASWPSFLLGLLVLTQPINAQNADRQQPGSAEPEFTVSGELALSALMSLGDGYLTKMADSLEILATADSVRTGEWERVREPLADLAERNVAALNWFALPDGSYWSVQEGRAEGNLSQRDYWNDVLSDETVLGDLVISTATGKPVAIVAVPVLGATGQVVGVLGASIYLDKLSTLIQTQLGLEENMIFYSFDGNALVALNWDPDLIFFEPRNAGDTELAAAFEEMLSKEAGVIDYTFRNQKRTVAFRKSPVTGWWYAFGVVGQESKPAPKPE